MNAFVSRSRHWGSDVQHPREWAGHERYPHTIIVADPFDPPCRGPPEWEMFDQTVEIDPIHPESEYDFDQTVSW